MKQLSKMRASAPLNLSSPLGGEAKSVWGDQEQLEAGKGGACQLEQHVLQSLPSLRMLPLILNPFPAVQIF